MELNVAVEAAGDVLFQVFRGRTPEFLQINEGAIN
jgi:hypothetical protein